MEKAILVLRVATTAFTFKNLLRNYAKQAISHNPSMAFSVIVILKLHEGLFPALALTSRQQTVVWKRGWSVSTQH